MGSRDTEMQAETPAYVEELAALNKQYYGMVPKVKLQKLQQKHGCGVVPDRVQTARRAQLREIFLRVNNTESITPSEFKKALTGKRKDVFRAMLQTQGKNWKDVFATLDTNHDGAVSCFEFVVAVSTSPDITGLDIVDSTIVRPAEMEDQGAMRPAASDDSMRPVKTSGCSACGGANWLPHSNDCPLGDGVTGDPNRPSHPNYWRSQAYSDNFYNSYGD